MCHVHLTRQVLKKVPKKKQKEVAEKIKEALVDRQKLNDLIMELDNMGYEGAADTLESFQYDVMNYMQFPEKHWKKNKDNKYDGEDQQGTQKKKQGSWSIS
ncbi:Mobile element protein [Methanosarcina siciliae C2J]|uniref:Mobile element protein n=1 Tax=Methanosarcina siciliae C2J TaxID=1434118 RepID=A0A0E3PKP6_9EURY|nr:Mobile element protein [Methanosarcina siciliae C2J]